MAQTSQSPWSNDAEGRNNPTSRVHHFKPRWLCKGSLIYFHHTISHAVYLHPLPSHVRQRRTFSRTLCMQGRVHILLRSNNDEPSFQSPRKIGSTINTTQEKSPRNTRINKTEHVSLSSFTLASIYGISSCVLYLTQVPISDLLFWW